MDRYDLYDFLTETPFKGLEDLDADMNKKLRIMVADEIIVGIQRSSTIRSIVDLIVEKISIEFGLSTPGMFAKPLRRNQRNQGDIIRYFSSTGLVPKEDIDSIEMWCNYLGRTVEDMVNQISFLPCYERMLTQHGTVIISDEPVNPKAHCLIRPPRLDRDMLVIDADGTPQSLVHTRGTIRSRLNYMSDFKERTDNSVYDAFDALTSVPFEIHQPTLVFLNKLTSGVNFSKLKRDERELYTSRKRAAKTEYPKTFYYSAFFDSRGRMYYQPNDIQGSDERRGLLSFKNRAPLGKNGLDAIRVQIANEYGEVDKASFEDRIAWVKAQERHIKAGKFEAIALRADNPVLTYRALYELWEALNSPNPYKYKSGLLCASDGSCNSVQIATALMRDGILADRVNIVPTDLVMDFYGDVAKGMREMGAPGEAVEDFIGLIPQKQRKVIKKCCMAEVYSISGLTKWKNIKSELSDITKKKYEDDDITELRRLYDASFKNNSGNILDVLGHIQGAVRAHVKGGNDREWNAFGFFVRATKPEIEQSSIRMNATNQTISISRPAIKNKINVAKNVSAAAADLVHSVDASILREFVRTYEHKDAFACIHDSFIGRPSDMLELRQTIRKAFVSIIKKDPLNGILSQFGYEPVELGKWNPEDGLNAIYMYS